MGSKTLRHSHKSICRSCHIAEQADPGLNGMKKKKKKKNSKRRLDFLYPSIYKENRLRKF